MRGGEHTKSFTYYLEPLTNVPSNELRAAFARMNLIPSPTAHIDGVALPNRTVAWSRNAPSHAMVSFAVGTMLSDDETTPVQFQYVKVPQRTTTPHLFICMLDEEVGLSLTGSIISLVSPRDTVLIVRFEKDYQTTRKLFEGKASDYPVL